MKLQTRGIDHLNMAVINLEESCKFWNELLGFETLEDIPEQHGKIIGNKNAMLALYQKADMTKEEKIGFAHVSFSIENFDEVEAKCKEMGLKIKFGGIVNWPKSRSVYIDDPNGYEVELSEVWGGGLV